MQCMYIVVSGSPRFRFASLRICLGLQHPGTYQSPGRYKQGATTAPETLQYSSIADHEPSQVRGAATEPRLCSTSMQSNLASSSPWHKVSRLRSMNEGSLPQHMYVYHSNNRQCQRDLPSCKTFLSSAVTVLSDQIKQLAR